MPFVTLGQLFNACSMLFTTEHTSSLWPRSDKNMTSQSGMGKILCFYGTQATAAFLGINVQIKQLIMPLKESNQTASRCRALALQGQSSITLKSTPALRNTPEFSSSHLYSLDPDLQLHLPNCQDWEATYTLATLARSHCHERLLHHYRHD